MIDSTASELARMLLRSRTPFCLTMAFVVATGASMIALDQRARPDPYRPKRGIMDTWRYPVQRNAFAANEVFEGNLNAVFALPDGGRVWAVGDGALLMHSDDGGRTWTQDTLDLGAAVAGASRTADSTSGAAATDTTGQGPIDSLAAPSEPSEQTDTMGGDTSKKMSMLPLTDMVRGSRSVLHWLSQALGVSGAPSRRARPDTTPDWYEQMAGRGTRYRTQAQLIRTRRFAAVLAARDTLLVLTANLHDVQFLDDTLGYAVGDSGVVLRSLDGGRHWTWLGPRLRGVRLSRVLFTSARAGWVRGDSIGYRTTDGGATWERTLVAGYRTRVRDNAGNEHTVRIDLKGASTVYLVEEVDLAPGTRRRIPLRTADSLASASLFMQGAVVQPRVAFGDRGSVQFVQPMAGRAYPIAWKAGDGWLLDATVIGTTAVTYTNAIHGVAVTEAGRVYRTGDGGHNWTAVTDAGPALRDVRMIKSNRGLAVGAEGTILSTSDGGTTWDVRAGRRDRIRDVDFVDAEHGWAVGSGGVILHTEDGGVTWIPQASPTDSALHAVSFADAARGLAVGAGGIVLHTSNGGRTWGRVPVPNAPTPMTYHAVQLRRDGRAWIAGSRGYLFASTDAGQNWRYVRTETGHDLHAVFFATQDTGWVAGDAGRILYTTDGGRTWDRGGVQAAAGTVEALTVAPGTRKVWAVGARGMIVSGTGSNLSRGDAPADAHLTDVRFADAARGWAAGRGGILFATTDSGRTWHPEASGTRADLLALEAVDAVHLWAAGKGPVFLAGDGRGHWTATGVPGPWYPAPWYALSWVVVLGLVAFSVPPRRPPELPDPVEGVLVSDRPLQPGDPDPFHANDVALGISRFLRNEHTRPPLTLAVTGPWGSGKSSLMNLIRADLERWGFRTVSFNAWHHQTEEHLLAAFLENVRQQAVPPCWRPGGLRFRLRLLWIRTKRYRPLAIVAALGATAYVAWLVADPARVGQVLAELGKLVPTADALKGKTILEKAGVVVTTLVPASEQVPAVAGLLGTLGVIAAAVRGAKAFGVKPAALMASVSRTMRLRDLQAQTSFRYRFAVDFDEVTRALSPRDMVIFVDDLDRCRSEHVLEILEAINFLVTSGRCVVIMGMDPERVIRSVGREFGDEVEDAPEPTIPALRLFSPRGEAMGGGRPRAAEDAEQRMRRRREAFARQYLEKLVNIEVPVPHGNDEQQGHLLVPAELAPEPATTAERALQQVRRARPVLPLALTAAACALVFVLGRAHFRPPAPTRGEAPAVGLVINVREEASALRAAPNAARPTAAAPAFVPVQDSAAAMEPPRVGIRLTGSAGSRSRVVLYLGALLAIAAGVVRLLTRAELVVRDSHEFRDALRAWSPYIIVSRRPTPRTAKKFLNRIRYYAMRQSAHAPPATLLASLWSLPFRTPWLARILGRMGFSPPATKLGGDRNALPEPLLVALAAVQECAPDALADDGTYRRFDQFVASVREISPAAHERITALRYPPRITDEQRALFTRISAGIRVS